MLVINLDRASDRLRAIDSELTRVGWCFTRIAAVDGKALAPESLHRIAPQPWSVYQARAMTAGEIGCLASHRLAWQHLIDLGVPWGVVLEDDARLGTNIHAAVRAFDDQTFFDVVKLEGIVADPRKSIGARVLAGFPAIYLMKTVSAGAAAYCVSRHGAAKLLRITQAMNREADFFIRQYGRTDLKVGEFRPFPAFQDRRQSYVGAARLEAVRPRNMLTVVERRLARLRESIARRVRFRRLAGFRLARWVPIEGGSATTFTEQA